MRPYRVSAAHYLLLEKIGGLALSRMQAMYRISTTPFS